jgi:hypothetical protein
VKWLKGTRVSTGEVHERVKREERSSHKERDLLLMGIGSREIVQEQIPDPGRQKNTSTSCLLVCDGDWEED